MRRLAGRFIVGLLACLTLSTVAAHEGHDHGAAPQPVAGSVAPRFEARSDLFELVGVLQGDEVLLYLDRAANNAPLPAGEIEIESGSLRGKARADAGGVFRLPAGALSQPGKHALTLTVSADGEVDLLTATLEHGMTASQAAPPQRTSPAAMTAGAALLALAIAVGWRLRKKRNRT